MMYLMWLSYVVYVLGISCISNGRGLVGLISIIISLILMLVSASKYEHLLDEINDLKLKVMIFEKFKNRHIDK